MASAEAPGGIAIELVYAHAPHQLERQQIRLPAGATVADALQACGWASPQGPVRLADLRVGIWGRPCDMHTVLRAHDRVELYRPLQVDPKEARRQRYRRDGLKKKRR